MRPFHSTNMHVIEGTLGVNSSLYTSFQRKTTLSGSASFMEDVIKTSRLEGWNQFSISKEKKNPIKTTTTKLSDYQTRGTRNQLLKGTEGVPF